jgi:DNA polymerase III subunit epsilon
MGLFKKAVTSAAPPQPVLEFAVVDVETTGLDKQQDRIVEIAVVLADARGTVIYEWSTLLNPGTGTAGPTRIHGITDEMCAVAPSFAEVAADLAYLLTGRVVVAHNSDFDSAFIEGAFQRCGMPLSPPGLRWLCTMDLADSLGMQRRLGNLCAQLGIFYDPHNALDDARVTSQVLAQFIPKIQAATFFNAATPPATFTAVRAPRNGIALSRAQAEALLTPVDLVARAVFRFQPVDGSDEATTTYHQFVHDRLSAGAFTSATGAVMIDRAVELGLSAQQTRDVHNDVLADLFDDALSDNRVSKAERAGLETAATWLGVNISDFDAWVKASKVRRKDAQQRFRAQITGKIVVMTGKGVHPTNIREALAAKHAFTITATHRPDAHLVVVGSETTTTAAVSAAQAAGTPVMVETEFWRRLGEL